jgi:hypothetical protein
MKQVGKRCGDDMMVQEATEVKKESTKRGSYFRRIRKYRPCGLSPAEGSQGLGLGGSIAIRALNRSRSSMPSSCRSNRKKQERTWTRVYLKVVGILTVEEMSW